MPDRRALLRTVSRALCAGLVLVAGATGLFARQIVEAAPPSHLSRTDGRIAAAVVPADGSTWAVWSYRQGAEYDVALSRRDSETGFWSAPSFFGLADGVDQLDPALVADASGNLYLAWAESGRILLTVRATGAPEWTAPVSVAPGRLVGSPALRVVGDRLIVAFRHGADVEIHELPLLDLVFRGSTIHDAPDPVLDTPSADDKGNTGGENPNYDGSDAPTGSQNSELAQGSSGSQGRGKRTP